MNQTHIDSWLTRLRVASEVTKEEPLILAAKLLVTKDAEIEMLKHQLDNALKVAT